ncbi:hypothetical protein EJG51_017365 [Undibacterium piscinae]|uniref:Uncharacterized protein n=1 Tax=Undibacterium piscinae TaxID=2495591 RepID=A0A6M4A7E7_9BURK|nr:hypothetical protein EJG51_017365 [Undibacterium piscinae]
MKAEQREKENLALKELNLLQQSEMDRVNLSNTTLVAICSSARTGTYVGSADDLAIAQT